MSRIAEILEQSYREDHIGGRFDRGLTAYISGKLNNQIDEGILCFERALEGILHPADSNQFCRRAERLIRQANKSDGVGELLLDIYRARSGFVHAHPLSSVFPGFSDVEAVRRGRELLAATYHLAARSYVAALSDPTLVRLFSGEQLGEYWGKVVVGKKAPPFTIPLALAEYTLGEAELDPAEEPD